MKLLSFALSTLFLATALGVAQEPPLPAATATPSASPAVPVRPELNIPDIPMTVEPAPLVPNTSAPPPKKSVPTITELDSAFGQSNLGQAVEQQRLHLEWRKLKNRVADDPEIKAAEKAANSADTELEKRNRRRAYYKLYYNRMQALAETPALKAFLEQKKNEILGSLAQPHVRPESTPRAKSPND